MLLNAEIISTYTKELITTGKKGSQTLCKIIEGYLEGKELRISTIATNMQGSYERNYKVVQRFLNGLEPIEIKDGLKRMIPEEVPYFIADPTEIERPGAKKSEYVGFLKRWKE